MTFTVSNINPSGLYVILNHATSETFDYVNLGQTVCKSNRTTFQSYKINQMLEG